VSLPLLGSTRPMCSGGSTRALPRVGSPIRKSPDQRLFSNSPGLIAAVHVLHRLLVPRHPPRALRILTIEHTYMSLCSFQGTSQNRPEGLVGRASEASTSRRRGRPRTRSLKTEQHAVRTDLERTRTHDAFNSMSNRARCIGRTRLSTFF
jgi:hypothetical protein